MRGVAVAGDAGLLLRGEQIGHLPCESAETVVQPVAGTRLVGEPAVNRQEHFVSLRLIGEGRGLVGDPQQLRFPVPAADVRAKEDEGCEDLLVHGVGRGGIGRAFDRDSALVVGVGG